MLVPFQQVCSAGMCVPPMVLSLSRPFHKGDWNLASSSPSFLLFFVYVWFSFRSARQGSKSSHLSVRYDRIDAALGFDSFPPSHVLVFYVFLLVTFDSAYSNDDVCSHTPVKATRVFPYTERGRGDYTRCRPDFLPLSSRIDLGHPKFLFGVGSLCVRCSLFLFLSLLLLWFMSGAKRSGGVS